jgi:SAM-dependent methyltransferase
MTGVIRSGASVLDVDQEIFDRGYRKWPRFWQRMEVPVPDLASSTVLDFGCGHGAFAVRAAELGARVVAIDLDGRLIDWARRNAEDRRGLAGSLEFVHASVAELGDDRFDFVLTEEVLEHVLDLPQTLREIHRRMHANGLFYAAWGPLWHSAFGGHRSFMLKVADQPIPYSHILAPDLTIRSYNRQGHSIQTIQDDGLNGCSIADYRRIFADSPFSTVAWRENVGEHPAYMLFRNVARLGILEKYMTANVYGVFRA